MMFAQVVRSLAWGAGKRILRIQQQPGFLLMSVCLPVFRKLFPEMLVPFYSDMSEFTQFVQLSLSSLLSPSIPTFLSFFSPSKKYLLKARGTKDPVLKYEKYRSCCLTRKSIIFDIVVNHSMIFPRRNISALRACTRWSYFSGGGQQNFLEERMFRLRPEEKVEVGKRSSQRGQTMWRTWGRRAWHFIFSYYDSGKFCLAVSLDYLVLYEHLCLCHGVLWADTTSVAWRGSIFHL